MERYLNKCIDSILEQTFKEYELILVDDGSTDSSGRICDEYAEIYNHIKVIHKPNSGQNAARLDGIRVAAGEYIQFIDSDDYIEPYMLESMYDMAALHNADVVISGFIKEDTASQVSYVPYIQAGIYDTKDKMRYIRKHLVYIGSIHQRAMDGMLTNKLFCKALIEKYITRVPLSIKHMEDVAVTMCSIAHSHCVVVMEEAFYHHTMRYDSITHCMDDNYLLQLNQWYLFVRDEMKDLEEYEDIKRQIDMHLINAMSAEVNKYMGLEKDINIPQYLLPKLPENAGSKPVRIAIYGAGQVGRNYYQQIRNSIEYELAVWVDKNVKDNGVQAVSVLGRIEFDIVLIAVLYEKMAKDIKKVLLRNLD